MPNYRLHYFPESGNSYKLALMLTLCGQEFEPVWTDFGGGVTRTAEWRRTVNPMGEIPVLEDHGVSLTQTAPILLRLADKYRQLQGASENERYEILRWLFWDNQKLSSFMATYRYLRAFTPSPDPHVLAYLQGRLNDFLGILEQRLQDRPFVIGDHPTVVDISMSGYLVFPKHESGYDFAVSHKAIHIWLQRLAALPGWKPPYDLLSGKRLHCYQPDR
jgi:glutathione S-transferase